MSVGGHSIRIELGDTQCILSNTLFVLQKVKKKDETNWSSCFLFIDGTIGLIFLKSLRYCLYSVCTVSVLVT